jgi:Flp pilus assembly protein TadD
MPRLVADDPDRMELWLQATGGIRLERTEVELLDVQAWQQCRKRLYERWPDIDPALSRPSNDAGWHDSRARDAEEDGNTFAALWHLERLLARRPRDWRVHARLGWLFTEAGDLKRAEAAYRQATAYADGQRLGDWYRQGVAALRARSQWSAALRYLDWLAATGSDDWHLHADRAEVLANLGKAAERDVALARAISSVGPMGPSW